MKTQAYLSGKKFLRIPILSSRAILPLMFVLICSPGYSQDYFANPVLNPYGFDFEPSGALVFPTLVDIDNDGDLDAFVSHRNFISPCWIVSAFEFYENQGTAENPEYVKQTGETFGLPIMTATISFVDIDADGDYDAFISNHCFASTITFHENTGNATLPQFDSSPTQVLSTNWGISFAMLTFGDLDGDGDFDALVNGLRPSIFKYLENIGTPTNFDFSTPVDDPYGLNISLFNSSEWSLFTDWDCDGDLDILNSHWQGTSHENWLLYIYENDGTATEPAFLPPVATNQMILAMTMGDMDGDGDEDIFSDEYYYENISDTECNTTIGINRIESNPEIVVYPNPATDVLMLSLSDEMKTQEVTIELFTAQGTAIRLDAYEAISMNGEIQLDVSGLTSGLYILKIRLGDKYYGQKFLKVD